MDDNDLVPFPNEVVSTLVEVVSFLIKLVVRLIAQQTTEPHDSGVCSRRARQKSSINTQCNKLDTTPRYSLLINSKLSRYSFTTSHHMFSLKVFEEKILERTKTAVLGIRLFHKFMPTVAFIFVISL